MQLNARTNTVISGGGIGEDSGFSIDVNAKMFRVLSDTMYQDKIGSMVRELSCNAMDSHIEAGRASTPFSIHLPDSIEPWFSVKDSGIGMSDHNLRTMYTTYGRSTKESSNDVVGAFGLGSKTPFAYTDQFTVTSIFDGVKRVYVALLSDNGLPILKMQSEMETSEHSGLEVNVSVRDSDYHSFREAATTQLQFFKVKPELLNNRTKVSFPDLNAKIMVDKNGVTIYDGSYNSPINGVWVVQGGVGYQLSVDNLGVMDVSTKSFAHAIRAKGAILQFPIGQIEVTASREGVSYTDDVKRTIINRLAEAAETIASDALKDIRELSSMWDRAAYYNNSLDVIQKAVQQAPDFKTLFINTEIGRNGKLITSTKPLKDLGYTPILMVKYSGRHRGSYNSFHRLVKQAVSERDDMGAVPLYARSDLNIFIKDTKSRSYARIRSFCETFDYPPTLLLESGVSADLITDSDIVNIESALGLRTGVVVRLSSIEAPAIVRNATGSDGVRAKAYKFPGGSAEPYYSKDWEEVHENINDIGTAVWVRMSRHTIEDSSNFRLVMAAVRGKCFDIPIIAVNNQTADRIEAGKIGQQLITVEQAADPLHAHVNSLASTFRAIAKYKAYYNEVLGTNSLIREALKDGVIKKINSVNTRIFALQERVINWHWAAGNISLAASQDIGLAAGQHRRDSLLARYPMLQLNHSNASEVIKDYIKMVDERG